jgi:hypothetical protein
MRERKGSAALKKYTLLDPIQKNLCSVLGMCVLFGDEKFRQFDTIPGNEAFSFFFNFTTGQVNYLIKNLIN